jgi:hypothetical protein
MAGGSSIGKRHSGGFLAVNSASTHPEQCPMKYLPAFQKFSPVRNTLSWRIALVCLVLAFMFLASGYLLEGFWLGSVLVFLPFALWVASAFLGWPWAGQVGFVAFSLGAAIGFGWKISPGLMLIGFCFNLSAWDLQRLAFRLIQNQQAPVLEKANLSRLAVVLGIGGSLAGLALIASSLIQLRINLVTAVLLVLGFGLAFSLALGCLRRE